MRISTLLFLLPVFIVGCATGNIKGEEGKMATQHFEGSYLKNISFDYLSYLPEGYESQEKWPLLIFLHGAGERGDDIELVKRHGPPKQAEAGRKFPFILLAPQSPTSERWDVRALEIWLKDVKERYHVDESRIYLTGISMGGYGTWEWGTKHPEHFAALIPICGGGERELACNIKDVPTWAFHGEKDRVVGIERSKIMVHELKKCGGNIKFTSYPGVGHDSWTRTYDNDEVYEWMLQQRK